MKNQKQDRIITRVLVKSPKGYLMLKRAAGSSRPGAWEVPGGKLHENENLEDGARREVSEETGLILTKLIFDHSSQYEFEGKQHLGVVFRSMTDETNVILSEEHDEHKWMNQSNYDNKGLEKPYKEYFDKLFATEKKSEKDTTVNADLIVYTDGGSRGNPGPSASGYVIMNKKKEVIEEGGEYLGITTNNQAEYQAVKLALEAAKKYGPNKVSFFIDSLLVVNQMKGVYKIKNRDLWPIHSDIKKLATEFEKVTFTHVRRENNKLADAKVNEVLDSRSA